MKTTSLFVELVVIGIGASAWFALMILCVSGTQWLPLKHLLSPQMLIPLVALAYLLGILTDRAAKALFDRHSWSAAFTSCFLSKEDFFRARRRIPFQLLACLDGLYFARGRFEERRARTLLARELKRTLHPQPEEDGAATGKAGGTEQLAVSSLLEHGPPPEMMWLLRWLDPVTHRLRQIFRVDETALCSSCHGTLERVRLMERLHFHAHRLLQRLGREDAKRTFLEQTLFRYLVHRTHHWQLAIQHGRTTGLRNFRSFFSASQRKPLDPDAPELQRLVMDRLQRWQGLRVLEGRVSPPEKGSAELRSWVAGYARTASKGRLRKFGLVIHFQKKDDRGSALPGLEHAPPTVRWGSLRRKIQAQAYRLYRILSEPSLVTPFVVGIDAADLELAAPPEVFAPAFRFLRELPIELRTGGQVSPEQARLDHEIRALAKWKRLGMTYHVGEDFRHLLSGLRAIYEVIEFLKPQPGDRLGHGTALALKAKVWAEQCGFQAVLPRQEWLDTLVWVYHFLGPGHDLMGELEVEDAIQRLSWKVYQAVDRERDDGFGLQGSPRFTKDWSPLALVDAWRLRQLDPYQIDFWNLCNGQPDLVPLRQHGEQSRRWRHVQGKVLREVMSQVGSADASRLLYHYWFNPRVRTQGETIELVDMEDKKQLWLRLCEDVAKKMRDLVHRRQLVVEVNPSSNRLIGPMARLDQHHIFEMTLDRDNRLARSVRVSINTDNPATCNTTLAHEYCLLAETLMRRGVPEAEVVEWLEWLRVNGTEYSFVQQLPEPEEPHMARLLEELTRPPSSVRNVSSPGDKLKEFWAWQRRPPYRDRSSRRPADERPRPAPGGGGEPKAEGRGN